MNRVFSLQEAKITEKLSNVVVSTFTDSVSIDLYDTESFERAFNLSLVECFLLDADARFVSVFLYCEQTQNTLNCNLYYIYWSLKKKKTIDSIEHRIWTLIQPKLHARCNECRIHIYWPCVNSHLKHPIDIIRTGIYNDRI